MKKVLLVLNSYSLGGAESIAISIIDSLSDVFHFGYCCLEGGNIDSYLNDKVERFYLKKMTPRLLKKVINDFGPDIIHANDFTASVCAALSTKRPIISHIHHNSDFIKTINLKTIVYNCCSNRFRKIVFVSKSVMSEYVFSKRIKEKSVVVPNLIDKEKILSSLKETSFSRFDLLFMGRLESAKNPLRFLRIAKAVQDTKGLSNLQIGVLGQGSLLKACQDYVREQRMNNVTFIGFKENPYPYLKTARVLCVSSDYEGYGLAAEEAKLLKTVVVANDVGGLHDLLKNTGILYSTDEEAVSEIKRLLTDENYYNDCVGLLGEDSLISLSNDEYSNIIKSLYLGEAL